MRGLRSRRLPINGATMNIDDGEAHQCGITRQPDMFDLEAGERAKAIGMEFAAGARESLLDTARRIAISLAKGNPEHLCDADMVARAMGYNDIAYDDLGPAAGALFKESCWEFTGRREKSQRVRNHARELKVLRYVG